MVADRDTSTQVATGTLETSRKQKLALTVASAIAVAVVFQAKTMAYNNYSLWRLEFMAIEWAVALAGSFGANLVRDIDERGVEWAASHVPAREGRLFGLLSRLPSVVVRGAIMTAFLSVPNATVIPTMIYREAIGNPVIAVLMRFLADIPLGIICCLLVRYAVERHFAKREAAKQA